MSWGTRGPFRVVGNSWFLSNYVTYLWEPLKLHKVSQDFVRVLKGHSGLHSRCFRGNGPHLPLSGECRGFLELQQEAWGSSWLVVGTSGNLSCCFREISAPSELWGEVLEWSRVTAGKWGLISKWGGKIVVSSAASFMKTRLCWGSIGLGLQD